MKRIKLISLLCPIIFLSCGEKGFIKTGASFQDFNRDLNECETENSQKCNGGFTVNGGNGGYTQCQTDSGPKWSFCIGSACEAQRKEFIKRRNQCMYIKGWVPSEGKDAYRPQ